MKLKLLYLILFLPGIVYSHQSEIDDYLDIAVNTGNWLEEIGVITSREAFWPISLEDNTHLAGLEDGAAGTGLFFLKLYQVSGNDSYLDIAKKAAAYTFREFNNPNKISSYGPDWLYGRAGGMAYLLQVYKNTNEQLYLSHAEEIAEILLNEAETQGSNTHWLIRPGFEKVYTGLPHGASGIGLVFLDLYEVTEKSEYLEIAKKAMNWINAYKVNVGSGIGWKRLTTDTYAYHHWSGGTVGIMQFLQRLYEITEDPSYLSQIELAADGLVHSSIKNNNGSTWTYRSDNTGSFPVIFSHGTASVVLGLLQSYKLSNDPKYLEKSIDGIKWLSSVKMQNQNDLPFWPHIKDWDQFNTGYRLGTASVGHAFVEYYKLTDNPSYLEMAKGAADYLIDIAETPKENQIRWINYTNAVRSDFGPKTYKTGWYTGAAGIGIFFLELVQALQENMTVSIENEESTGLDYTLSGFPNPFNPTININFSVPEAGYTSISVFNILGQKVHSIANRNFSKGNHNLLWDANGFPSGLYFLTVKHKEFQKTLKITLLK